MGAAGRIKPKKTRIHCNDQVCGSTLLRSNIPLQCVCVCACVCMCVCVCVDVWHVCVHAGVHILYVCGVWVSEFECVRVHACVHGIYILYVCGVCVCARTCFNDLSTV